MARGDILCPICNQVLTLPNFSRTSPSGVGEEVGQHVHYQVNANGVCSNGHRWVVEEGDILYRRIN